MALQYIGIDPDIGQGNCPTVWVDDKNDDLVLQARMMPLIREACDVAERART